MFFRKSENDSKKVDIGSLNEVIILSKKILKIAFFFIIILGIYACIMVLKELKVLPTIMNILKVLAPLFIGLIIAWLFDPLVTWLQKKGVRRILGTIIIYVVLLLTIFIIVNALIPVLSNQINDFVKTLPSLLDSINSFIDGFFDKLGDASSLKNDVMNQINVVGSNLTSSLPMYLVNFAKSFVSGLGTFIVGLIIGFYLLVSFDENHKFMKSLVPENLKNNLGIITKKINNTLRKYVAGALMLGGLVFVLSSIGFLISGLKAPLLFGLFCGLTDVIPYLGPYIGGVPAVIVGFSQSTMVGIITLIAIVVIQFIEGNFLQPVVMSKQLKLHPVTIISGLLIFGYFFGIIGMAIAAPVISVIKILFTYFDERYNIIHNKEEEK